MGGEDVGFTHITLNPMVNNVPVIQTNSNTGAGKLHFKIHSGNSTMVLTGNDGQEKVGIGTTNPTAKLQLNDENVANFTNTQLAIYGASTNAPHTSYANILFGAGAYSDSAGAKIAAHSGYDNYQTKLVFSTASGSNSSVLRERMVLGSDGNVTINDGNLLVGGAVDNGVDALQVNGSISTSAGYGQILTKSGTEDLYSMRVLHVPYLGGGTGSFTFNPLEIFGLNIQGGMVRFEVSQWELNYSIGYILWRNNGNGAGSISSGFIQYIQLAHQTIDVSVSSTEGNNIVVTLSSLYGNPHGWQCRIIA
jgi:hypothetical protein